MSASYSWERHKHSEESSMSKSSGRKRSDDEDLLVFGYSCKIFVDEKKARFLDQGKHLIPWMGSDQLLIDRFDVRGYLQDLKKYEAKGFDSKEPAEELSQEELQFENKLDEERFADLKMDDDYHEEEMKRLKAALAIDGPYHEIGFQYETNSELMDEVEVNREETVEEEPAGECIIDPFILPPELTLPDGIELPQTMKQHNLIEKTAKFISAHGVQMEILIKTKQSSNSQFDFLAFDSPLNPYYKHLVHAIKSGKYNPKCDDANSGDESVNEDDDSEDDNYLHPSLLGSRNKKALPTKPLVLPTLPRNENDSYAQLVKSLRGKIPVEETVDLESKETTTQGTQSKFLDFPENPETRAVIPPVTLNTNPTTQSIQNTPCSTWPSLLPPPPPEIELIIEKLAQYVAKNGEEFEFTVRKRNEERFEFLNPGNKYHAHYIRRKLHHLEEKRKTQAAELKLKSSNQTCVNNSSSNSAVDVEPEKYQLKTPVSFCFKKTSVSPDAEKVAKSETAMKQEKLEPESKKPDVALADKLAAAARDRLSREKMLQEERKRKAALFISMMRNKELIKKEPPEEQTDAQSIGPSVPMQQVLPPVKDVADSNADNMRLKKTCDVSKIIHVEMNYKKTSCLPFLIKDEPLKESAKNLHVREKNEESRGHKHHRHHRKHDKCRSRSKSRSPLMSRSRSHHSKSFSRSRTRSRSTSRSKKLKRRSRSRSRTSK